MRGKRMSRELVIGTSALILTFRCNLRCKLCCTSTPHMPIDKQVDFPLESLTAVVDQYFKVAKYIRKLSFGGGEPTLHKQLPALIEHTMQYKDQFEVFEIITNGAAVPRKEVLDMAEKYKDTIFFMIDNYGENVSRNADNVVKAFTERGIRHTVRCYHGENAHEGGWVDLGDFTHKHDKEEASRIMSKCVISGKKKERTGVTGSAWEEMLNGEDVFFIPYAANTNGLIHRCARAYSTLQAGAVENTPECFVDIMAEDKTVEEIREQIVDMFTSDHYPACEYCNGFDETSKRYEPAEQMK